MALTATANVVTQANVLKFLEIAQIPNNSNLSSFFPNQPVVI